MELSERERRILAELEAQFTGKESLARNRPVQRRGVRPQWTVMPSAVLGILLLVAGILLGVTNAVLMGLFLVGWWSSPWLLRSSRRLFPLHPADGPHH